MYRRRVFQGDIASTKVDKFIPTKDTGHRKVGKRAFANIGSFPTYSCFLKSKIKFVSGLSSFLLMNLGTGLTGFGRNYSGELFRDQFAENKIIPESPEANQFF